MRLGVTRHWSIAIALTAALASAANAQTAQTGPTALSFDAAQLRFDRRSRAISAADHGVDAAKAGRMRCGRCTGRSSPPLRNIWSTRRLCRST
ncbi:hypothetical protein QP162_11035 [Sphingomonas aurantiaca]|uniref:hypothetical protein n=1 Tax=Sphingomonas aurantiaca TaxID=185949 RepID=UPI002FE116C9